MVCLYGVNSARSSPAGSPTSSSPPPRSASVVSKFSFGFHLGTASVLETLCGQAYGAGQVAVLGLYMQRSRLVLVTSALLLSLTSKQFSIDS